MRKIGLALTLLGMSSLVALAESEKTTILVQVTNQYDKPVDNAAVILDFLGSHQLTKFGKRKPIHWEVRTNQQGKAHFPPIPSGTVQLQVITRKYQTFGQKMDVDGDEKTVDIQLKPPQKQYSAHEPLKPAGAPEPK